MGKCSNPKPGLVAGASRKTLVTINGQLLMVSQDVCITSRVDSDGSLALDKKMSGG